MERNRLTFLVITDPSRQPQAFQFSQRRVRAVILGVSAFLLLALVGSGVLLHNLNQLTRASRLEQENALLAANLQQMQEKVDQLSQSISAISDRDRRFRLLAGLSELDPEVRQVGIGGPGTPSVDGEPLFELNSELGQRVYGATADLNRLLRQSNLLAVSLDMASQAMEDHRTELAGYPSIDPTEGWLSSSFSRSRWHPLLNVRRPHEGVDISAQPGTPVVATADGRVTYAGFRPGYGWTVEIEHGDNGYKTRYAHNQRNLKVKVGDRVSRGDIIAHVGSSGLAKGPHVHYEVLKDGRAVNPNNHRLHAVIVE